MIDPGTPDRLERRTSIVMVSSDGGRTGAPAIMLGLLRWLKRHHRIDAVVVLMRDGDLREVFEAEAPTHIWRPIDLNQPDRLHRRLGKMLEQRRHSDPGRWLVELLNRIKPDVIYLSTLVLGKYLHDYQPPARSRVISHVHELLPSLLQLSSRADVRRQISLSNLVIAPDDLISRMLQHDFDLAAEKCVVIPEFVEPAAAAPERSVLMAHESSSWMQRLHQAIDRQMPIVGIGGNPISRKGFDLFPLLLQQCRACMPDTPFLAVWIGCSPDSAAHASLDWDLEHLGLQQHCLCIPSLPMPAFRAVLSKLRVLTLLSREDPFPLVALEAARLGIPTVCFEGSGAIPSLAAEGCCVAVPYLDLTAYAEAVWRLIQEPAEAQAIGLRCRDKVEADFAIETVAPRLPSA